LRQRQRHLRLMSLQALPKRHPAALLNPLPQTLATFSAKDSAKPPKALATDL
jgi:hypothetical protein